MFDKNETNFDKDLKKLVFKRIEEGMWADNRKKSTSLHFSINIIRPILKFVENMEHMFTGLF